MFSAGAVADAVRDNPSIASEASPAPIEIESLCPTLIEEWEEYVSSHNDSTFFHGLAWQRAVKEAFAHEELYLCARRKSRLVGIAPLFYVASKLGGRMLVSVPYGVGGGIIANDKEAAVALFEAAKRLAKERRCTAIDLRSDRAVISDLPTIDRYVGFSQQLPDNPDDVLHSLPRKARAAARNARAKYELSVSYGDEHLSEVWRLYTISMRRLASLNYPFSFFESLIEFTPGHHWVSLVRWNGRPVAGLVTFLFKDRVLPYFFGAVDEAKLCSAANFIYLSAMERGAGQGYRVFDFGRSRRDNAGSCDFKRFQGAKARPLAYQVYVPPGKALPDLSPTDPRFRMARRIWPHLPLCITRALGARVAKHIPG